MYFIVYDRKGSEIVMLVGTYLQNTSKSLYLRYYGYLKEKASQSIIILYMINKNDTIITIRV